MSSTNLKSSSKRVRSPSPEGKVKVIKTVNGLSLCPAPPAKDETTTLSVLPHLQVAPPAKDQTADAEEGDDDGDDEKNTSDDETRPYNDEESCSDEGDSSSEEEDTSSEEDDNTNPGVVNPLAAEFSKYLRRFRFLERMQDYFVRSHTTPENWQIYLERKREIWKLYFPDSMDAGTHTEE